MLNTNEILETIRMISQEDLNVRTVTTERFINRGGRIPFPHPVIKK